MSLISSSILTNDDYFDIFIGDGMVKDLLTSHKYITPSVEINVLSACKNLSITNEALKHITVDDPNYTKTCSTISSLTSVINVLLLQIFDIVYKTYEFESEEKKQFFKTSYTVEGLTSEFESTDDEVSLNDYKTVVIGNIFMFIAKNYSFVDYRTRVNLSPVFSFAIENRPSNVKLTKLINNLIKDDRVSQLTSLTDTSIEDSFDVSDFVGDIDIDIYFNKILAVLPILDQGFVDKKFIENLVSEEAKSDTKDVTFESLLIKTLGLDKQGITCYDELHKIDMSEVLTSSDAITKILDFLGKGGSIFDDNKDIIDGLLSTAGGNANIKEFMNNPAFKNGMGLLNKLNSKERKKVLSNAIATSSSMKSSTTTKQQSTPSLVTPTGKVLVSRKK